LRTTSVDAAIQDEVDSRNGLGDDRPRQGGPSSLSSSAPIDADRHPGGTMTTWADFAAAAPALARDGAALFSRAGVDEALLATVRGHGSPRIHPVNVKIVDGRLLLFVIVGSAKAGDLAADGRYALHAHQDPAVPHEFQVRGRAVAVTDAARRAAAAASWWFEVDEGYALYELSIEHAVFGRRASADDWPPVYESWRPQPAG
jgi:hypothetical protein